MNPGSLEQVDTLNLSSLAAAGMRGCREDRRGWDHTLTDVFIEHLVTGAVCSLPVT